MFEFAWVWVLATVPLPLLLRRVLPPAQGGNTVAVRVPFFAALRGHLKRSRRTRFWPLLGALAWCALVVAAARPQWIGHPASIAVSGRDLVLAVDLSFSMETADMELDGQPVSRLQMVKEVGSEFIERRHGDRLALILFGRQAYLQTPLTFDRTTVAIQLQESAIGLAGKETAIGDAIGLAVKRLREQEGEQRVLILLTDGANTAGEVSPQKAADLAANEGLRIYTIGVGADEMVVPSMFGDRRGNPSVDLDEEGLTAIAEKTGGRYFRARDAVGLADIYRLLDEFEPVAEEQEVVRPPDELYIYPLAIALLVSVVLGLIRLWPRRREVAA